VVCGNNISISNHFAELNWGRRLARVAVVSSQATRGTARRNGHTYVRFSAAIYVVYCYTLSDELLTLSMHLAMDLHIQQSLLARRLARSFTSLPADTLSINCFHLLLFTGRGQETTAVIMQSLIRGTVLDLEIVYTCARRTCSHGNGLESCQCMRSA